MVLDDALQSSLAFDRMSRNSVLVVTQRIPEKKKISLDFRWKTLQFLFLFLILCKHRNKIATNAIVLMPAP